jgi:acylpyruvate hydrolase
MRYATLRMPGGGTVAAHAEGSRWRTLRDPEGRPLPDLGALLRGDGRHAPGPLVEGPPDFAAPVPRPPKIVAVGLNYRDHAAEQNKQPPERPMLFSKASNIVVGPGDPVRIGATAGQVDFECELAVVVGRGGLDVPEERALEHVFGYTILNDVTAREAQHSDKQFYRGKSFDTFCPTGPVVVTPDELDWRDLPMWLDLNGTRMQNARTSQMIFGVPFLVAYVSAIHPLEPGDLIATGTPAGVLMFRPEKRFLVPGDVTEAGIEGIGVLKNRFEKR